MKFSEWMNENGIKTTFVADKLGVSLTALHYWIKGKNTPSLFMAVAIEELTKGKVKPRDWLPEKKPGSERAGTESSPGQMDLVEELESQKA